MKKAKLTNILKNKNLPINFKNIKITYDLGNTNKIIVLHNFKSFKFKTNSYSVNGFYKKIY